MTGSPHFSNYPMTGSRLTFIICVLGAAACVVAFKGGPAVGAIGFAFVAAFLILAKRTGTITSHAGITVRGVLRTKMIPWAEIQDIRVKVNPVARAETDYTKGAPKQLVTVYDNRGKRTVLPNINEETLRKGRSLEMEVEHICTTWELLRGGDWGRMPDVSKIAGKGEDWVAAPVAHKNAGTH
jgi:hypothetical protein